MTIDLAGVSSVQNNLFVRIQVDQYRNTATGAFGSQILRFSDLNTAFTINGEVYLGLGNLMGITDSASQLRVSSGELTISLSGIPDSAIAEIVNSRIKGSSVRIFRAFFDSATGAFLDIPGNPLGRFRGFVDNFALQEEYDNPSRTSSNTLALNCASSIDVLTNKITGRKTNPSSQKQFFPNDLSMDRVPNLENATFDFGAPE